jgi:uncharacterized membrane protein YkoI
MNDDSPTTPLPDQNPSQGGSLPPVPGRPAPHAPAAGAPAQHAGASAEHAGASADGPFPGAPAPEPAPERKPRRGLRLGLIGAGAGLAVLLIGGTGAAIALSLSDDDDDRDPVLSSTTDRGSRAPGAQDGRAPGSEDTQDGPARDDGTGIDDVQDGATGTGGAATPSDADALVAAIDAAIAEADGEGATAIDITRSGYEVDVLLADGTETEVRVDESGAATVSGDAETTPDPALDTARIADIVDAALAETGGGTVSEVSTDDDASHLYDVTVDLPDGGEVDLELADDLSVVEVDRDDD